MKIGLVGASYQEWSLPFSAQRCVNLYAVADKEGKEVSALYGTPGFELFGTAGAGAVRWGFPSQNGRGFFVSGANLYEIDSAGTTTNRGSLLQSSGAVSMDENPTQLAICDGTAVYTFTYATNTFAQVPDLDLPSSSTITFIDGYFIVGKNDSGSFYISGLNDGTSWAAVDFATAESSPDALLRVFNALGQLYLFGESTTEIWTNTGASAFPFQRIAGGKMEVGILAPYTAIAIDNSVIWLGKDKYGKAGVYRARGISPTKISTEAIDILFQEATNADQIVAFAYQEHGHTFIMFTGGGLATSLVIDLTTQLWHERAYLNTEGVYEQHRASCLIFIFNKYLIGDRVNGNIYSMDMDIYSDNGDAILRERIYTHLIDENKRIRYNVLNIGFETGVGLQTGQGSTPLCSLQLSKDGAKTWSTSYTTSIGAVGKYQTEVNFRRLGIAQQMTFRLRISDPVKVAICGSYLNA